MSESFNIMNIVQHSSTFPPSFEGNGWIFLCALFCTMLASLVSLSQVYLGTKELFDLPDKWTNPINIYRYQIILAYLTILFAVCPDAIYLWTFGEVTKETSSTLLNIDRIFDSLFLIPFGLFSWLTVRCSGVMKYQLLRRAIPTDLLPAKTTMKTHALVGIMILLMSIGVTLSK